MPQRQRHRGKHPQDNVLFAPSQVPMLRSAVSDLSHLLSRGYAERAALKLVGDHYQLTTRQRRAVLGASCSEAALRGRVDRFLPSEDLSGRTVIVDGYNQLIITESILSGGVLLRGRDGCLRDLASVHGSYRRVEETVDAVYLLGKSFQELGLGRVRWLFDAPVSNSGRLRSLLEAEAQMQGWPWEVSVAANVDKTLAGSRDVVITSDGWIVDRAKCWTRVDATLLHRAGATNRVIDLAMTQSTKEESPPHGAARQLG